jgi:trehalose synthase
MDLEFPRVSVLRAERYASLLDEEHLREVLARIAQFRDLLTGHVVWNVSSTAVGGGVAEMVRSLLAYARGAGVDARWVVVQGSPAFFKVTKRLHNALHGAVGDGSPLGDEQRRIYELVSAGNAAELAPMVREGDVVVVHDPQPAGLVPSLLQRGAKVIWRCHVGHDRVNEEVERGWNFIAPYVLDASAYVFSRAAYVPTQLDGSRAVVIPPTIDPYSPKNQFMSDDVVHDILTHTGLVQGAGGGNTLFEREDGTPGRVDRVTEIVQDGPSPAFDAPLVVQVSRWDRLKDPIGVLHGFGLCREERAHLILAGPSVAGVADDPEGASVHAAVVQAWAALPDPLRRRCHLASLPTDDVGENAAIVNALQRHASVVVQKSLHEGFGLTVAEAMWKSRPVVASAVGGIVDQIDDGVQGLLLRDPTDRSAFAGAVDRLLADAELARRMGQAGQTRVTERLLGIGSLLRYGALIELLESKTRLTASAPQTRHS